ncbi:MAG: outer membrane beta-barrel protein [Bacteroidota bacterium]|nr:outer membrane beta-barrel protein [Bacteroidota bacterium]
MQTVLSQVQVQITEVVIEAESGENAQNEETRAVQDIKILSRKEIRHVGSKGVGEILKRLPGIVVQGPPMAYRNVKVNGLDKEYQTIFIDGHRPAGGEDRREFKLDRLPSTLIKGVEVMYNPTIKYGGTSPAGIINIITRDVPEKREYGIDLGLDHSNTFSGVHPEGSLYFGESRSRLGYLIYAGRYSYKRKDITLLQDETSDISGVHDELSTVSLNTASARVNYKVNSSNDLKFNILLSDQNQLEEIWADVNRRSQGGLSYKRDSSDEIASRKLVMTQLKHVVRLKDWNGESSVAWDWSGMYKKKDRIREKDPDWERSLEEEQQYLQLFKVRSDWERSIFKVKSLSHILKSGFESAINIRDFDRLAYSRVSSHKFWDEFEDGSYLLNESVFAAYFSDVISENQSTITPGLRIEYHSRNYATTDTSGLESYWTILPAIHGKHSSGDEDLVLRWSLSRQMALQPFLYMVPVLKVKHKKEIIEQGNPNLLPAKSWNYHASMQKSFGDHSKAVIRVFLTDIRDVVEMKFLGVDQRFNYRIFEPTNIDTARIFGANIDVLADFSDFSDLAFRVWGNYSWNGSRVRDPGTRELRRLNDQTVHITNINIDYLIPNWSLRLAAGITFLGKRESYATIDPTGLYIPGFYYEPFRQLDFSLKYYFSRWGYFSVSIHNLLGDREILHQESVVEELLPGRLARFGFSLSF